MTNAVYEAFGQKVATAGSSTSAYLFAATSGYRDDGDAGLMHVGARYYDAEVGRFISRDTLLTQKAYVYCEGDPVNALDPSGHRFSVNGWPKLGWDLGWSTWAGLSAGAAEIGTGGTVTIVVIVGIAADAVWQGFGEIYDRIKEAEASEPKSPPHPYDPYAEYGPTSRMDQY